MEKIASRSEAADALDSLFTWVFEKNFKYEDCPSVFDALDTVESFVREETVETCRSYWPAEIYKKNA